MILLILNLFFNGLLLGLLYLFGAAIMHKNPQPEFWLSFGYGITATMMLIGASSIGVYFLKLYLGCRVPINSELLKIKSVLCEVINQVNYTKGTNYKTDELNIVLVNSQIPNSAAIGGNTIILSDGLLNNVSEDELKAIIAQELGHLYNRDSFIITTVIFGSIATKIVKFIYTMYMILYRLLSTVASKFGKRGISLIPAIALIPFIIFLPVIIINWISNHFFDIILRFMYRQYEYRADIFAKETGYKEELVSYLKTVHIITRSQDGFLERIFAAKASAMKRINRLCN